MENASVVIAAATRHVLADYYDSREGINYYRNHFNRLLLANHTFNASLKNLKHGIFRSKF